MSTPASRAGRLRGGLVGACAALVTAVAHVVGGGGVPMGSAVVAMALVCAMVGAGIGALDVSGRRARIGLVITGLGTSQALGHAVLTTFANHCTVPPSAATQMVLLHVAAAVGLGLLIGVVEYLYVVGSSVVTWLRLFVAWAAAPAVALPWRHVHVVVARAVLLRAGLGMRAPPAGFAASA